VDHLPYGGQCETLLETQPQLGSRKNCFHSFGNFFPPGKLAVYSLEVPANLITQGIPNPWEFPCLVHKEDGEEEILWGATFEVIRTFFKIVFDFSFPASERVVRRPLVSNYLSGRKG